MIIAAIGAWYAGWVDELIQRITEINLVLPFLALLIMIGFSSFPIIIHYDLFGVASNILGK